MSATDEFISAWRAAIKAGDHEATLKLLADEMTFHSPVIFKPATDRMYIDLVLGFVAELFEDFEYVDEFRQDGGAALLFQAKVGDLTVDGVDFFKINEAGKATELKVMIRPLNTAMMLAQMMKAKFEAMASQ